MATDRAPTPFTLWLEEALTGWILPIGALVAAGAAAGLYFLGLLPEGPTGAALAALVSLVLALFVVKPALSPSVDATTRAVAVGLAVVVAALTLAPAAGTVWPGAPLAQGDLAAKGDALALPPGLSGNVKLLVHAPLPPGGTPQVDFRLAGTAAPAEGRVERTLSYARVGRGTRAATTHDRNEIWVHGSLPAGAAALTLDRLSGPAAGPLHVSVFREALPPAWHWAAAVLALLAAGVLQARLGRGSVAVLSGMSLAYGLLVAGSATPAMAVGTSIGAVMLGAILGALAGGVAGMLGRFSPWRAEPDERGRGRPKAA